ncbi:hypothetical protein CCR75_001479 [Bremia lactucae]|uniref:Thioredoxin domain-containing protein n=1 Tax=Bremia lactucae TaxID=4779 RepID=A0A976P020_BRELC|nr:hypothetical protein CCR75_001479 [Bremia lactucae]
MLLRAFLGSLCVYILSWRYAVNAFEVITTTEELAAVERSAKVYALLIFGTEAKAQDMSLKELALTAYPELSDFETELEGLVTFGVLDIAPHRKDSIGNKWKLKKLPALVIYKGRPKENPYTGKYYRESKAMDVGVLNNPRKLKKMLKQAILPDYVQELQDDQATLTSVQELISTTAKDENIALLVSKQKHASPMYRALAAEFYGQGLTFVFLNKDQDGAEEIINRLKIEDLPSFAVLKSLTDYEVLKAENLDSYAELKKFVEPFAVKKDNAMKNEALKGTTHSEAVKFFTEKDFDDLVLRSNVIWIIEFMDAEREETLVEEEWKALLTELHRKAGIVSIGAVSCEKEAELCERHGGPGVRIYSQGLAESKAPKRGDIATFATLDEAKEAAIAAIPDVTTEVKSAAELNIFVTRAREQRCLPILFFTAKTSTPPMIKAMVLSVRTQRVMLAVVHDADENLKKQFMIKPSTSTSLIILVPTNEVSEDGRSAPFGVVAYEKKKMGAYNYPNIMQFLLQVLAQYPHPQIDELDSEEIDFSLLEKSAQSLVPYMTKENMADLCSGNKICAIGFFEDHIETLRDSESRLTKWYTTLVHVAAQSKKNKEPFHFMWVNGKCQMAFAEAFGIGIYQMPTLAVYSPSKHRYATNVGLFDEENAAAFLKSVLSGRISTAPIGDVPELNDECPFKESEEVAVESGDNDDDLDDMLSEILSEEKQQREEFEKELKFEQKKAKKRKTKKSKKAKSMKKKKSKHKKPAHDEL